MPVNTLKVLRPIRGLSTGARYALTTVVVLLAFGARWAAEAYDIDFPPFLLFLPAILLASFAFDRGSGFYATVLSGALALYFFVEPRGSFAVQHVGQAIALGAFVAIGFLIAGLVEALRNTADQLGRANADLATANRQLADTMQNVRRAEAALRASEERARAFIEHAPEKMWITGPDGSDPAFNAAWRAYAGEAAAEAWLEVIHPEDRPRLAQVRADAMAHCRCYQIEIRLRRESDDAWRWHLSRVVPVELHGTLVAWVGTATDIDEIRGAEAALRASEERSRLEHRFLETLFRQAPIGLSIAEAPSGRAVMLNDKATDILGHGLLGDGVDRYAAYAATHPDGRPYAVDQYPTVRALKNGEVVEGEEMIYRRPDGAVLQLAVSSAPVRDEAGRIVAAVTTLVDVGQQRRIEEALRESEERFRLIVENARDYAILTTAPDGRITAWPPGAQAVFGYAPDEILGQDVEVLFTPEDRAAGAPQREREEARRNGHGADQRWHVRKTGERFWVNGSIWPLRDSAGREHGFLKVGRDDTLRRRAELLMQEALERQAMVTREVGHRIKNNLAIVTSLLGLQARNASNPETREALASARARIDAIAQVHDQLWRQDQAESIDLDAFLRDLCTKVQDAVPHHRIAYEGEPVVVAIDRAVPISLLINELITNAVKYAYPSGEGGPIGVALRRLEHDRFQIEVRDQGIGMPAELGQGSDRVSFGSKLIRTFTRQLGAELAFDLTPPGTRVVLTIPEVGPS